MAKKSSPKKRGPAKGQSAAIEAHTKALKEHARALSGPCRFDEVTHDSVEPAQQGASTRASRNGQSIGL